MPLKKARIVSRSLQRLKFFLKRQARKVLRLTQPRLKANEPRNRRLLSCSRKSNAPRNRGNRSYAVNQKTETPKRCLAFLRMAITRRANGKSRLAIFGRGVSGSASSGSSTCEHTTRNIENGQSCGARGSSDKSCR